jgi:hypothetical protein
MEAPLGVSKKSNAPKQTAGKKRQPPDAPFGLCDWCGLPKVEIETSDGQSGESQKLRVCLKCFNKGRREHGWD